jgi:hypothetical protein
VATELEILQKRGLTEENLKAKFTSDAPEDGIKELKKRISSRIIDGRTFSFTHWKLWQAIDALCETPFRQASSAVLMQLSDRNPTSEETLKTAGNWGLTHLIQERQDPKTGKKTTFLDIPKFFNVFVPLARSFSLVRAAKLTTDRIQVPLFKWEPPHDTPSLRKKCEVLTDRVEGMTNTLGYRHAMQQVIRKAVEYGQQLQFIQENWYAEKQLDVDGDETVVKEGLRFKLPHPSWTYYDQNCPPAGFNSDIGPEFGGYWMVKRYAEVSGNKKLWNRDRIAFSNQNFSDARATSFFQQNGCVLAGVNFRTPDWSNLQRETEQSSLYTSNHHDSPVMLAHHFEKLVPKDYGLGDYEYPVWMWFIVASDDTILYAAPLPHCPITYWGYDTDDTRLFNVSMTLECAPWEMAISNLFTQQLLSVKSNLANLSFINSDFVDEPTRKLISNLGQAYYTQLNLVPISGRQLLRQQSKVNEAVHSVQFPRHDVNGTMAAIQMAINLMERSLVMSAQEVGSTASHEQSAEEMRAISSSTSVRLGYTGLGIDNAIYALKGQLYAYLMAYGDSEFYGYVSPDDMEQKDLEAIGFTVNEKGGDKWKVSIAKSALRMEQFSSVRDGQDRSNSVAIGTQMVQLLAPLSGKLLEAVPADQVVGLFNRVLDVFQLPRDWRLKPMSQEQQMQAQMTGPDGQPNPNAPASQEWVVQQITGLAEQIAQAMKSQQEGTQQAVQQVMQSVSQEIQPIAEIIKKLTQQTMLNSQSISELSKAVSAMEQSALTPPYAPIDEATNLQAGPGTIDPMVPPAGV